MRNPRGGTMALWPRVSDRPGWRWAAWALLLISAATAAGGVYRWVDAQGQVHYGDRPPPGTPARAIQPAPAPAPGNAQAAQSMQDYLRTIDERNAERSRAAEQKRDEQQREIARKAQCESSRARRLRLERPRQLEYLPDGSARRLTEEERQARIQDVEKRIADACPDRR